MLQCIKESLRWCNNFKPSKTTPEMSSSCSFNQIHVEISLCLTFESYNILKCEAHIQIRPPVTQYRACTERLPSNIQIQYRSKLWDHLPRICLGRFAVLICGFTWAKPRLTAIKTSVSPRFFSVDLSRGERQDAVGFE